MAAERKTLTQLSVPICLETLFYMLSGMVDTLMLSSVSDQAVGAVGTANTYIGVFIIMFWQFFLVEYSEANWGVMGVAAATVISRVVNLMIVAGMGAVFIKAKHSPERMSAGKILTQIANFSYCVGSALEQANAILTGWKIGAREFEECDRGTRKAALYGIVTATCFSVTFALFGHFIVRIFTDDTQMINLVVKLLIVDVFLEFGRVTNLVYGQALKTSGDAIFPVILGAIFMYLFAVGGTYFLGIHIGLLAVGAYIAMAGDACARAVGMVLRWKSKSLIES